MEVISPGLFCPYCGFPRSGEPESLLHLPPGTLLQDRYLLGRALGQGGFGITYLGWDTILNLKLAIKEYLPQQLATRSKSGDSVTVYKATLAQEFNYGRAKFLEEARTLARFNEHPNIVTVRDYFEANNTAYLVMNYIAGVTMQNYLESQGGKLPADQVISIFMPVLDALKEVHSSGFLHRDISPDNLLINTAGRVILIDFGAARQAVGEKSKSLSVILKAGYSPPEQYQSRGKQGPWTDVYAVAATIYRALAGQPPLEAIDRLTADDLKPLAAFGVEIEPGQEQVLLKALAVNAGERFQAVGEFQKELVAAGNKGLAGGITVGVRPKDPVEPLRADIKGGEEGLKEKAQRGIEPEAVKKAKPVLKPEDKAPQGVPAHSVSKRSVKTAALVAFCGLLIFGAVNFFYRAEEGTLDLSDDTSMNKAVSEEGTDKAAHNFDPALIAELGAGYYIDYSGGTIPLGDLPIGARVVDPGWEWEFRTGGSYTREEGDETKPVTWLVVAKNHYENMEPHVTLLSEELIGYHFFDNSNHVTNWGYNHWGESGAHPSANHGLRSWLNSDSIHSDVGFYRGFSESFKLAVLTTSVPNKEWQNGSTYSSQDKVFIPSTTELGDNEHTQTYQIGAAYPYFQGAGSARRIALLGGEARWYWTRSPYSSYRRYVRLVTAAGDFHFDDANNGIRGVRPALNLKSEILVSEMR